ncbi:spore gernimation protein GerPD [Gracilibacillus thailandensis]|uniref:Spore gernimation protein GerPD n=1 Tax=Gracilibacillus thailandensis TaxID=563735 RepID=A0A6N7QU50_9BACI|nr:spore gernimation protein GerPD [Gracilibacillus thailandensis]MRI65054.1 spore gernimation protein GerPD [Gracilibacillus thailandensis]
MYYTVNNWNLGVGNISVVGVSSSSLFIVGDSHEIQLSSLFDTPPESFIVGSGTNNREEEIIDHDATND